MLFVVSNVRTDSSSFRWWCGFGVGGRGNRKGLFGCRKRRGGCVGGGGGGGAPGRKMQLHFSPSMRSITISSSSNGTANGGFGSGGGDLMKIKLAARHISYRTLFHTILILAFLLPFVFILTALITLEGVNKCSTIGTNFLSNSFLASYFLINAYCFLLLIVIGISNRTTWIRDLLLFAMVDSLILFLFGVLFVC